ncbi:MAG: GTP cyclohydrolase I FolE [Thermoproteota archaeon]|mgnify:FL=1
MDEERVRKLIRELIIEIGEDPTREGLRETPNRIVDMYKEIFSGYDSDSELSIQFSEDSDAVIAKDIQFYSMCEHHMLPFFGKIHIAYSPNGRVFGISKLVRLVEKYSKRLQIQERLTKNIADELFVQGVKGVAVVIEAEHLCMKMRGVKNDAKMTTHAFRGVYERKEDRKDIIAMIKNNTNSSSFA